MFTPWNACPLVPCNGRRAKHIPLGPAPWNESCPGEHLSFGSFAIPLAQNLSHRSHAIPLGPTPLQCLPREIR